MHQNKESHDRRRMNRADHCPLPQCHYGWRFSSLHSLNIQFMSHHLCVLVCPAVSCSAELMGWQKHQEHLVVHISSALVINASPGNKTLQEQELSCPAPCDLHKPNQTRHQTLGIIAEKFAPLLGIYKPTLLYAFYRKSKQ